MIASFRNSFAAVALLMGGAGVAQAACCGAPAVHVPAVHAPNHGAVGGGAVVGQGGAKVDGVCCAPPAVRIRGVHVNAPDVTVVNRISTGSTFNTIFVGAQAEAQVAVVVVGGGGGGVVGAGAVAPSQLGALKTEETERVVEKRTRIVETHVPIRAICLDDRGNPNPASQTFAGETVPDGYQGELFRCVAGTSMQVTVGRMVDGRPVFDDGRTLACAKGEALARDGDELVCRTQVARRPCNERSLLRRYGPGIKIVKVRTEEHYEHVTERQVVSELGAGMTLDGGVGQGLY